MANISPPLPLYAAGAWDETEQRQRLEPAPPQTGTTLPFIWPPPHHIQSAPDFEEPVLPFPPPESLLVREMELDAFRCEDPTKHQGTQVYDSLHPPPHDDYTRVQGATAAGDMPRWYIPEGRDDDTLVFESRFESGNLRSAEKMSDSEYNLHLAFDINTDRHTQWFYFRVSNLRIGRSYKLNMQNLMKSDSVYNMGMQPLAYSQLRAETEGVGWHRAGSDICYFKNQLSRATAKNKPFWTLTFSFQTDYDDDTVYLAHSFPYRYSDLERYLCDMEESALSKANVIRRRTLCHTLAGNDCDMLTITSLTGDHASKKGIVISARVHPGETNASWMMKGVLDCLVSDNPQAAALRDKFVFKIVPMLNPDGVIVGNYRCSLAGGDLNRQYEDPKRELFPEVVHLKQMIANFRMGREVMLYVDLHGHSKKSNIFMYGVENPTDEGLYMRERVIPTLLDRASSLFNLKDCSFDVGKGKEGCGRVVVRKHLGIVNAYTMEASFMGADQGAFQGLHFNQNHFESMGHSLCEILLDLVDPEQTKVSEILQEFKEMYPIDQSRVVAPRDDDKALDSGGTSDESDSDASPLVRFAAKPPTKDSSSNAAVQLKPSSAGSSRPGSSRGQMKKSPRAFDNNASSDSDCCKPSRELGKSGKKCRQPEKGASATSTGDPVVPPKMHPVARPRPPLSAAAPSEGVGARVTTCPKPKSPPTKPPNPRNVVFSSAHPTKAKGVLARRNSIRSSNRERPSTAAAVLKNPPSKEPAVVGVTAAPTGLKRAPKVGGTVARVRAASAKASDKTAAKGSSSGVRETVLEYGGTACAGGAKHSKLTTVDASPRSTGGKASSRGSGGGSSGASGNSATGKRINLKTGPRNKSFPKDIPNARAGLNARRPASSPASHSLSNPRRQAAVALATAERSPSAPPRSRVGSKRRGVGIGGMASSSSRKIAVGEGVKLMGKAPVSRAAQDQKKIGTIDNAASFKSASKGSEEKRGNGNPLPPPRSKSSTK